MKKSIIKLWALLMICIFISCRPRPHKKVDSPPGYDFSAAIEYKLPHRLNEISGITINNNAVYAIQDELGRLYQFQLGSDDIINTKFGERADYEDLAILDSTVFVLESNGSIHSFPLLVSDTEELTAPKKWPTLFTYCEYEGLYADVAENRLYALSKECQDDKSTGKRIGHILEWKNDSLILIENFAIDITVLQKIKGNNKIKLNPSALAQHPDSHQWYILSASNRFLLITDEKFTPLQTIKLKESEFSQPEGISFDKDGSLYIANEKGETLNARINKYEMK